MKTRIYRTEPIKENPADILHYISNKSQETARVLVIKAPIPENKAKIL